jgi:hypothetical protein
MVAGGGRKRIGANDAGLGNRHRSQQCHGRGGRDAKKLGADRRVTVIEMPAVTVPEARNSGMTEARGEWIAFLDDDDI